MHLPTSISQPHWLSSFLPPPEPTLAVPATPVSLRILFPAGHDWEANIRASFAAKPHRIDFADLTPENIRKHDLVVPLTIPQIRALNEMREAISRNPIPIPRMESVVLCDDKLLLNRTLIASGFGNYIPHLGRDQEYPYLLKKRKDAWGMNSHIVRSPEDEARLATQLSDPDYFCQAGVFGKTEHATHLVIRAGRIVQSKTVIVSFEKELFIKGRERDTGRSVGECPCLDLFEQILVSIGFEGLCCFNYKMRDGEPLIFELNPRFGASLAPLFAEFISYLVPGQV